MASVLKIIPRFVRSESVRHDIMPCGKHICLCVEYLDFGKKKDRDRYKHCFITHENNEKYEKNNYDYDYEKFIENYI